MKDSKLKRILYAEDEPDIQAIAKFALESLGGYTVELCGSGTEALRKAPAFAPDLVLLDVMMPEMDGPATMKNLHEMPQFSATPVVFMTAKVQQHEVREYLSMGAAGVIAKPFDPMTLAGQIQDIWEQQG